MANATLIISQPGMAAREMPISSGTAISIGRALDNAVCFDGDANVSRYHAVIEARADGFWLSDLGSANGTTLNNQPVSFEQKLKEGDLIVFGGSSIIEFRPAAAVAPPSAVSPQPESAAQAAGQPDLQAAEAPAAIGAQPQPGAAAPPARSNTSLLLIGALCLGTIAAISVGALYLAGFIGEGCVPTARIVSPQSGTTVRGSVRVRVDAENAKCIERIVFQLDGTEVARAEVPPYSVQLNASEITGLTSGNHILTLLIEDEKGRKKLQADEILLAFEFPSTKNVVDPLQPTQDPGGGQPDGPVISSQVPAAGGPDLPGMSLRLASQISRKSGYVIDPEFAELIRLRTNEYRLSGYTDRARQTRREINKAFTDKGLEPLVGYVMAMSRSRFSQTAAGDTVGLWQIPPSIAQKFLGPTETPATALSTPQRSAEIAASYMKELINIFGTEDFMYAVACFGMPPDQAGELRTKLATLAPDQAARRDFWKMVKLGIVGRDQADRVARFFAAGIVGENPQQFGLQSEQPFSSLY